MNRRLLMTPHVLAVLLTLLPAGLATGGPIGFNLSATVLSKSKCRFNTAASTLNFGVLDPSSSSDATATATVPFVCNGSANPATFLLSDDDGLYETGPNANRMRHATAPLQHLPYSLNLNPTSATVPKGSPQTLTITGTVSAADYQNAFAGTYADIVVLTITP